MKKIIFILLIISFIFAQTNYLKPIKVYQNYIIRNVEKKEKTKNAVIHIIGLTTLSILTGVAIASCSQFPERK